MKNIFTLGALLIFSLTAFSQRLLTEDFNYAAGQLTDAPLGAGANVSGGVWVSNTGGAKFIPVVNSNLTYTDYYTNPTVSSRAITIDTSTSSAEDVYTNFSSQTNGVTVYASFLLKLQSDDALVDNGSDTAEYFITLLQAGSTSTYIGRLYARKGSVGGTFNLGISASKFTSTPISWSAQDYNLATTNLVTIGYQIISGTGNDVAKLWVNKPFSSTEPTPTASSVYTTESSQINVGRFAIRQGSGGTLGSTPQCIIDALKVSTDWADATLPVTLKSFTASLQNNKPVLNWITTNEINMGSYVIERSNDAKVYYTIANVFAKNGSNENTYSYTDIQAQNGTAWYRIKMVDNDGTFVYSNAIPLSAKSSLTLALKANPVQHTLIFTHSIAGSSSEIQIINFSGKVLINKQLQPNTTESSVNVALLASGTYYLVYQNENEKTAIKFVKQ